jgi:DNA-binding XRE family transcriptional regulator
MRTRRRRVAQLSDPARGTRGLQPERLMALLGICHRTIHTRQHPHNKSFLLRKPLPSTPASVGERFRLARIAQGYTQHETACKLGVSLSAIKFWEQNRYQPSSLVQVQVEAFVNAGSHNMMTGNKSKSTQP